MMPINSMEKIFIETDEFRKFYNLAKSDPYVIISVVLSYNPVDKPVLKDVYDARLLRLSKENPL